MTNFFNTPPSATSISKVSGLTLCIIHGHGSHGAAPTAAIRLAIESSMYSQDPELGLKVSNKKSFRALWAGSSEEMMGVRHMYRKKPEHMRHAEVISLGDTEEDWLQGHAFNAIVKYVEAGVGCLSLFWSTEKPTTPRATTKLALLRQQAQQNACHVVVFVVSPEAHLNAQELRGLADRMLVIKPCEPDPQWAWAFTSEFISQGYFGGHRPKMMCQMNADGQEYPQAAFEPYLHDEWTTRLQWHLRKHGMLNKDIASAFGATDSNISRTLKPLLPKYPASWKSKEEVEKLLALALDAEEASERSGKKPSAKAKSDLINENGQDNEDDSADVDEDDDDDFTHPPKKSSKLNKRR